MNMVWIVFYLGVLINVSSCESMLTCNNAKVNITPYSEFFHYKENQTFSFFCQGNFSWTNESRWLFIYPDDNFDEAVETEGFRVNLTLQASDNGSRLLCYHRAESGPPYLNYSDIITFMEIVEVEYYSGSSLLNTGLIAAGSIIGCFIIIAMVWFYWQRDGCKNKVASLISEKETYINQEIINTYKPPAAPASAPAWEWAARTVGASPVNRVTNRGYSHVYGNTDKNGKLFY